MRIYLGAPTMAFALGMSALTAAAAANPAEHGVPSGDSMSGMMQGPPGMMSGMPTAAGSQALGGERPQLGLALENRAALGLSAEQEKTLRGLVERFGKESAASERDIAAAERELAGLLKQEPPDMAKADGKVRGIEKLRADLRLRRIRTIAEGRAALNAEQRAKLDRLAAGGGSPRGDTSRGMEEMQRFMSSERMPQAMNAMMAMAERMGSGDTMLGMVRMMEMMSMMGGSGMMGGGGMMDAPQRSQPPREDKQ